MDWSRAKTIFIVTFLLLNIFLGFQLNEKKSANKINLLAEATLQERLLEMNITITADLQEEQLTGTYISGSVEEPLKHLVETRKANHEVKETYGEFIFVDVKEPFPLNRGDATLQIQAKEFIRQHIIYGEKYRYSHFDEQLKLVHFYQVYEGKKVDNFENGRSPLILHLDEQLQVIRYEQNYLTIQPIHPQGKEQELLTSIKAIEKLFNVNLIPSDSQIHKVELTYLSFFKPIGEIQVFAPMWKIAVNEQVYFVNAIDGAIQNIQ